MEFVTQTEFEPQLLIDVEAVLPEEMVMRRAPVVVLLNDRKRGANRNAQQEVAEIGPAKSNVETRIAIIVRADETKRRDGANPAAVDGRFHRGAAVGHCRVVVELIGARGR